MPVNENLYEFECDTCGKKLFPIKASCLLELGKKMETLFPQWFWKRKHGGYHGAEEYQDTVLCPSHSGKKGQEV